MTAKGIISHRREDLTGSTFGRLRVLALNGKRGKQLLWDCVCSCGTPVRAVSVDLKHGHKKSCGCLRREASRQLNFKHGKYKSKEVQMLKAARGRAKRNKLPFNLTLSDVVIPKLCPLLDIPLVSGKGECVAGSPSLDRKRPALGYVRGNVWVVSRRANTIKQDASLAELEMLVERLRVNV